MALEDEYLNWACCVTEGISPDNAGYTRDSAVSLPDELVREKLQVQVNYRSADRWDYILHII